MKFKCGTEVDHNKSYRTDDESAPKGAW